MPTRQFNRRKAAGWIISASLFCAYILYHLATGQRVAGSTWLFFVLTAGAGLTYLLRYRELLRAQASLREVPVEEGGIYSVENEENFGVVKVLVVDEAAVHVRVYKNTYRDRPATVDPKELILGTVHDRDGSGIGHLPIAVEVFRSWWPQLIDVQPVVPDELEGYEMWKEGGGGIFRADA